MNKFKAFENTLKITSIVATSVQRSLLPNIAMGIGRHSTPKKDDTKDLGKPYWEIYFDRKNAYDKITCDIKALDLLNKSWVRIPRLANTPFNWTHTFTNNLFPTQSKSSQTDFSTVTESPFTKLSDSIKNNMVADGIGPDKSKSLMHGMAIKDGKDPDKSASKKADSKDRDFIDDQIILEDKRINDLFHQNIHPTSNIKDLFDTNIFSQDDNDSYQRFFDIIDHIDVDNAMQVHDVRKKKDHEKIIENSEKKDGLLHNPARPDAAEQPVLEETESAEVWQPLNANEGNKLITEGKHEHNKVTNTVPIEGKSEHMKDPKASKMKVDGSRTDICKILTQAVDLFIDVLGDNKDQLSDYSNASQEKPIEVPSVSLPRPLETISANQEKPFVSPSVNHEKPLQALSVNQEKPIETPCVSHVNPLETISAKQEQALSTNQEKPLDITNRALTDNQVKHLETPGDSHESPVEALSVKKGKILDTPIIRQDKPLQVLSINQEKVLETPSVSEDKPLQVQAINLKKSFQTLSVNQDKQLETINKEKHLQTLGDSQEKPLQAESLNQKKILVTNSVSQALSDNQEKHIESLSQSEIKPVQTLSVSQEKLLETSSQSQEKHLQVISVDQEKSLETSGVSQGKPLQAVSINQDNQMDAQVVSQEKPIQNLSVSKGFETSSVNQEKPLQVLSVCQEKSLQTPSVSNEKPLETPSVSQVKPLGTLSASQEKPLQDPSVKEVKPLETAKEITPKITTEEKPLITESINVYESKEKDITIEVLEKEPECKLPAMLNKIINSNRQNLLQIELPASNKLTREIRTLIIENKLPVKVRE